MDTNTAAGPRGALERPAYYWAGDVDVIRVCEEYDLGMHIGNALKYVVRAGKKGSETSDLLKALEYLRRWDAWGSRGGRPDLRGSDGLEWMDPLAVCEAFGLGPDDWKRRVVIALLEAAVTIDEDKLVGDAVVAIEERLRRIYAAERVDVDTPRRRNAP